MARSPERRRRGRVLTTGSGAAALLLALTPSLAARPISDEEAGRRLDEARHDFAAERHDRSASTPEHLLKVRPDDADAWEMKPVSTELIRERFARADDACYLATKVDVAPATRDGTPIPYPSVILVRFEYRRSW